MLCPEVFKFPCPKVVTSTRSHENCKSAMDTIKMNTFYKSFALTCPDEIQTPSFIEELMTEDTDYYKLMDCPVTEFLDVNFIENFVKKGEIHCITANRNCVVQNCAALTSDGVLTLHILDFVYQTLGLEGKKRPHNYYEIALNLKNLRHLEKLERSLSKLETFDFFMAWEPSDEAVCPSSIAKYFHDKDIKVSLCTVKLQRISPSIEEIPALEDVEVEEMVEWIGMLAHNADVNPTEGYVSTYGQPESKTALKTSRISVLVAKGLFTPTIIESVCSRLEEYVASRELSTFWASASLQSFENCLWQWSQSSPRMFQAHDSSCNLFFSHKGVTEYSIGQIKY